MLSSFARAPDGFLSSERALNLPVAVHAVRTHERHVPVFPLVVLQDGTVELHVPLVSTFGT